MRRRKRALLGDIPTGLASYRAVRVAPSEFLASRGPGTSGGTPGSGAPISQGSSGEFCKGFAEARCQATTARP